MTNLEERTAELTAHRACGNQEQDAANGKLAGYCVVCQVPWPCDTAKPRRDASEKSAVMSYQREIDATHPMEAASAEREVAADAVAMRLVGERHDKRDLVDLVRWLILRKPDGLI